MKNARALLATALTLGLCGCQSMAVAALKSIDEKPFAVPVPAAGLQLGSLPAEPPAAKPVALPAAAPAIAPEVAPLPPERTDIRGAGDGSMKVDRVIVTGNAKEIAHKVPDFSREQVAGMVCEASRGAAKGLQKTKDAYAATVAAHEVRVAYEAGGKTRRETDAAEKKRQAAVKELLPSGMIMSLFGGRQKKADLPPATRGALILEEVDLFTFTENGKEVMAVSGVVRNSGVAAAELPPLTMEALDNWEFILAGQTSLLSFEELAAGESKAFELRFHNPPDTTAEIYLHFAPPFEYRARRGCGSVDPMMIAASEDEAAPAAPPTIPMHTAGELNGLMRIYRNEAQAAWKCRKGHDSEAPTGVLKLAKEGSGERSEGFSISIGIGKPDMEAACKPAAQRLQWREMFELAEATDEAWGAMLGAEDVRQKLAAGQTTQAEVDEADAAQKASYALFRDLGREALVRAGASVADVDIALKESAFGYAGFDKGGFYLDVSGELRNAGETPRKIDALMLAVVDRLEQPLISITLDDPADLEPGGVKAFKHRIHMYDPNRSARPDRPPNWQVRIGAMGK